MENDILTKMKKRMQIVAAISGVISVVFYFLHDFIGAMHYPGYNWMSQACSDLTASDAVSYVVANSYCSIHKVFNVLCCVLICILALNVRKSLKVGLYLFTVMHLVSTIGYSLFPLSSSGYDGSVQSFMHVYVVTVLVVILSIAALIVIAVGSFKDKRKVFGILALVALLFMFLGPVLMGSMPLQYFGIFERFSTYSAVIFTGVIGFQKFE